VADDRTYIKLHDGMPDHPKVEALDDDAAAWLLVSMWAYSSRHQSDGQVPQVKARRLTKGANTARCRKLVEAGLLHDGESDCCPPAKEGHYYCHDYLVHQRSAEQIAAMKEQRRNAGRNGGIAKGKRAAKQTASDLLSESSSEMPSKTLADTEGSSYEEPQTERTSGKPAAPPRLDVEQVCSALAAAVERNGSKRPVVGDRWRTEARLMLDRDQRPLPDVLALIEWATSHKFWRANILSVPTLREKYDRLRLQRESETPSQPDSRAAWFAAHPHINPVDEYLMEDMGRR
jgi:hypothetical protein